MGGQLYHITTNDCWESIKKTGFIPKNSGLYADNYPGRVYMFPGLPAIMPNGKARIPTNLIGPRKESAIKFIKEMVQKYKDGRITKKVIREVYEHRYDWNKVVIISINLKDKNSYKEGDITTMYRLFDDPRTNYGVFTYENIDPVCLSLYCSYDYEDNPNLEYLFKDIDF